MILARAVHGQMAVPRARQRRADRDHDPLSGAGPLSGHDERAVLARRLRAAEQEQEAAFERARVLMYDLVAMRRRAASVWN